MRTVSAAMLICLLVTSCRTSLKNPEKDVAVAYSVEDLQRRTFDYFWELADSVNYQILLQRLDLGSAPISSVPKKNMSREKLRLSGH
jgi:hypothetical protein